MSSSSKVLERGGRDWELHQWHAKQGDLLHYNPELEGNITYITHMYINISDQPTSSKHCHPLTRANDSVCAHWKAKSL